jgi:Icc-related predicted phosphoesterase
MRVLGLSDQIEEVVYSPNSVQHFKGVDLIVGCGDLPADYLEFAVSMFNVPLVYVPGNHDPDVFGVPGGISVDNKLVEISGLQVMGLGGSRRYKQEGRHQYTETQMRLRVGRMLARVVIGRILRGRRVDLLVTHSPPLGIHDASDLAHTGFESFHTLLQFARPRWMLHGHSHVHRNIEATVTERFETKIINVYPYRMLDLVKE